MCLNCFVYFFVIVNFQGKHDRLRSERILRHYAGEKTTRWKLKLQFYKKIYGDFFCFLGNVLIGEYTIYIQKNNNFRLVVCSPAYCLKEEV